MVLPLLLLLLLFVFAACGQDDIYENLSDGTYEAEIRALDSLKSVLNQDFSTENFDQAIFQVKELTEADTTSVLYVYGLMYQGWFHSTFQRYDQARYYFTKGYGEAEQAGLWELEIELAPAALFMYTTLTELEKARQLYLRLLNLRAQYSFNMRQENLFKAAQAMWLQSQNQMAEALEVYFEVVEWFENEGDEFYISSMYNSIGLVLSQTGNYEEALEWFEKALERQYKRQNVENIDRTLNNMGYVYRRLGDFDRAIMFLNDAKTFNEARGRNLSVVRNLYNIGQAYALSERWDQALATFQDGYEISAANDLKPGMAFHQFGIATVSYETGRPAAETLVILNELAELMDRHTIRANAADVFRMLHELEEAVGNYEASLHWYKRYHEQVLLTDAEERKLAIENVLIQNQLEREKAENAFLRDTLELKRQAEISFILILLVLLLLIAVAVGFLMYYRYSSNELQVVNQQLLSQSESIASKNKQLQELAQERQRLINVIIHDLRNPLSVIESLDELFDPSDAQEAAEMKDIMLQSAQKMRQLVNSLLTIFEAESADISRELKPVSIHQMLQKIVHEYRLLADKKNIQIVCEADEITAVSHRATLNSIVTNLLSNAIKYSYPDTTVTVNLRKQSDSWTLRVRDQGQGFLENERDKVFSLFAKLSAKPTAGESSVGVGLYAVKTSTERLGGSVEINWAYQDGAEFVCTFPINTEKTVAHDA
ncbi:ATP-binding protein [Cyclonatronum proteinivorum]|uniref:ATP-binding protein n=1 Tax=Cyclonatronum proteinivorum TaxID=1457365 RepID=UPI001F0BC1BB|nr:tetratricopeptide repeat protein [Cyclonatronum proteinivorum]